MMPKTIQEAVNRGNNLMVIAFLNVLALGWVVEAIREDDLEDKFDDVALVLFAIIALVWFFRQANRYQASWVPFILLSLSFVVKIIGIVIEINDAEAVGDDIGVIIPFAAMVILTLVLVIRNRNAVKALPQKQEAGV
jgi:succinate-acetate transporter protein